MAVDYTKRGTAYLNVFNGKYAVKSAGAYGTPVDFKYLKTVPLNAQIGNEAIYADGVKILTIYSDQGYTGDIGTTAADRVFEEAVGQLISGGTGISMDADLMQSVPVAFYFEYNERTADGIQYTVKNWLLNVEISKANRSHNTNTNAPAIGEYAYPATINGEKIMASNGTDIYVDEYGNEHRAFIISCLPNATGYSTFGDTVPTPKMPSNP